MLSKNLVRRDITLGLKSRATCIIFPFTDKQTCFLSSSWEGHLSIAPVNKADSSHDNQFLPACISLTPANLIENNLWSTLRILQEACFYPIFSHLSSSPPTLNESHIESLQHGCIWWWFIGHCLPFSVRSLWREEVFWTGKNRLSAPNKLLAAATSWNKDWYKISLLSGQVHRGVLHQRLAWHIIQILSNCSQMWHWEEKGFTDSC